MNETEMFVARACRACLATDARLHAVDPRAPSPSLYQCYRDITGIAWSCGVQYVCFECAWLLRRAHSLRERSLRAHLLLESFLATAGQVTEADILNIDRLAENLKSQLTVRVLEPIDITEETSTECAINDFLKVELEGAFIEDSKIWLQDVDNVKQEIDDDEWHGEQSPVIDSNVSPRNEKKRKKCKKAKVKKKLDGVPKVERKTRKCKELLQPRQDGAPVRRKNKKELAEFYSRFVSVAPMTQQEARDEVRRRLDAARRAAHTCTLCHRGFWRAATYHNHMAKHDPKNGDFECDFCHFRFNNRHSLLDHFRHFHNLRFSCKRCPYTCTNRNLARQHEAWHNGTLYSCKHCSTNFSHYSTMQNHIRLKHALEVPCRLCGRCFVGRRGVRAHQLRAHAADQPRTEGEAAGCDACGVRFASGDAYRRHLLLSARHNPAESAVVCAACGEGFTCRAELLRHRRAAHAPAGNHKGQVEGGGARGARAGGGEARERRPRAKKPRPDMMCETCGKVFHTNWDFDTHRRKHTGEKPFKCKFCGKAFALKGILKVHLRSHTQEKPHVCDICSKAFAERSNMLRHMQVHAAGAAVACELCEKEFKNASSLKVHVKYVHLKRPYPARRRRAPAERAAGLGPER